MTDPAEWYRWFKRTGRRQIRELLMAEWDPVGVSEFQEAQDEYDSCVGLVADRLRRGGSVQDVAAVLDNAERSMGMEQRPEETRRVASLLRDWYAGAKTEAWIHERLLWSLRWIAAEPDAQLAPLRDTKGRWVMDTDEIALGLEDDWDVIQANGYYDEATRARIAEIDALFGSISGQEHEERWTDEALRVDPIWREAREKARALLTALGGSRDDEHLAGHV